MSVSENGPHSVGAATLLYHDGGAKYEEAEEHSQAHDFSLR